jgi:SAM-dependent methyltransferase
VAFLEQYQAMGDQIFAWRHFEQTAYFRHATLVAAHAGHYFQSDAPDDIWRQAKYFATVYDSIRLGARAEVTSIPGSRHSSRRALPMVQETLTPGTTQILDGHHRLSIAWVLGTRRKRVIVRPPQPTELQRLVLAAAKARGIERPRQALLQPVEAPEFDRSWPVVGRCQERLAVMQRMLSTRRFPAGRASVLDAGCEYGWFVLALARAGWETLGVDPNAAGLRIGRSVYGLEPGQLVQTEVMDFLRRERRFDVVLCLDPRRVRGPGAEAEARAALVEALDRATGSVLFLATAPRPEGGRATHGWDPASMTRLLKERTRFAHVVAAQVPEVFSEPMKPGAAAGGPLLACFRS